MTPIGLGLRAARHPVEATAWLIAGGDCSVWFDELGRWRMSLCGWRGAVLPRSIRDSSADSLLVLPLAGADRSLPAPDRIRASPWTIRAGRIAHPVTTELWPPVHDDELLAGLFHELIVLHPGIGTVGFASSDLVDLSSLIAPPPRRQRSWSASVAPPIAHLGSIEAMPMTVAELYQAVRDDIGGTPLGRIPTADKEPGALDEAAARLTARLAKSLLALGSLFPHTGSSQTWVNRMEDWARRQLGASAASLDAIRHRELARLMKLLDEDLDKGLRYALPIGGGNDHRGTAPPGALLPERRVDFDLGHLRGGRRIDPWGMPPTMRQTLEQRYRAAAQREVGLGRHRRAAYILSHLLGDHAGAARALEHGRHWREAAILWRERVKQLRSAATCLERGELWGEAAQAWAELKEPERQAVCLEKNGQPDTARAAWRAAVEASIARGDVIGAAKLTDQRLGEPEAALGLLAGAWPDHPQAAAALGERLGMLGRMGRHQAVVAIVADAAGDLPPHLLKPVLETMVAMAASYPDDLVRSRAADAGRCMLGVHMAAGTCTAAALALLPRLDPGDRLLGRDLARWARQAMVEQRALRSMEPRAIRSEVALPSEQGGQRIVWRQAAAAGSVVVAIGLSSNGGTLFLARLDLLTGAVQIEHWNDVAAGSSHSFFLNTTRELCRAFLLCDPMDGTETAPLPIKRLPSSDAFPLPLAAGTHGPIQPMMRLACACPGGGWWNLIKDEAKLSLFIVPDGGDGAQVRPLDGVDASLLDHASWLIPIGQEPCLAAATQLTPLYPFVNGTLELPYAITNAVAHPEPEESCVVLALASGAVACWSLKGQWHQVRFAEKMRAEMLTFTRGGMLVICDGQICRAWRISGGSVRNVGESRLQPIISDIAAITAGPGLNEVVVIASDGAVRVVPISVEESTFSS